LRIDFAQTEKQKSDRKIHEEYKIRLRDLYDKSPRENVAKIKGNFRSKKDEGKDIILEKTTEKREQFKEYKDGKKDRLKEISYEQKEKLKEFKDVKKEKLKEFSVEKRGQIKDFSVEKREKIKEISAEKAEVVREKTREVTREVKERAKRENWYTIPNAISLSRIISAPITGYCIMNGQYNAALYLNVVSLVSDWADGKIARTWPSQQSALGTALDPLADKITMLCVYYALFSSGTIPAWLFGTIISRDIALILGTSVIRYQTLPKPKTLQRYFDFGLVSVKLNPTWISKTNTVLQFVLPTWLLLDHCGMLAVGATHFTHPAFYATFATTFISTLEYFVFKKDLITKKNVIQTIR